MEQTNIRQKLFGLLGKYWWVLLILVVVLALVTDIPIFKFALWGVGIIFALMIFAPFLFQLFAPAFFLISSLVEHFSESKGQSVGKRYFFIPAALLAYVGFVTAQLILLNWVFILSFLIWASVIGFFFTFLTVFFFGLAPIAILTAPFVVWYQAGFAKFLVVVVFFLITLFWFGFSKMAFSEDYWKSTPEIYLGYSPHIFLLGALSFQVVALPLYQFGLNGAGNLVSDTGGAIFLLFALISVFKWRAIKKKLSEEERENLYKPSAWIYIFGFILTSLLYAEFKQKFGAPTAILFWLNGFFFIALIGRFFGIFKRKKNMFNFFKNNKSGIADQFEKLRDYSLLQIQEAAKTGKITKFEEKAFISFCAAANIAAQTYITSDKLPYIKIENVSDEDVFLDAYFFLCAIEVHTFFDRLKNKKEIADALDVSKEKFIEDFAAIFGGEEIKNHLVKLLSGFDKMVSDMGGDPRDLWYNQALFFGNKLSQGKMDFGDLTEKDLAAKLSISIVSQSLQVESAKMFDSIVFGKDK